MYDNSLFRMSSRGRYQTDFNFVKQGMTFPPAEARGRNACYRFYHRLYDGTYANNLKLKCRMQGNEVDLPYKHIAVNFFKLVVSKLDSLFFSNDIIIKTGDIDRDEEVQKLVERTGFISSLREGFKLAEIEGDAALKVYVDGMSAFSSRNAFKVVDESNTNVVLGYVLYEFLTTELSQDNKVITHIRFEVHTKGEIFEQVFEYNGSKFSGVIGLPVRYRYKDRWIPKSGRTYKTGIDDCANVQWLALNKEADGCYGQSSFLDFKDIIFALESRLSSELWVEDNHEKPFLVLGAEMFIANEETGGYELKQINGKYLIGQNDSAKPEYLTWDGKLDNSQKIREDFLSYFYELSELGKTFLSGEYQGNISEETLNNTIKSAIDRGNRDLRDFKGSARDALYCLCRLNGIDLEREDISINFNVGRSDDDKVVAEVIKSLHETGVFAMSTLRSRYFGYNENQSQVEDEKIAQESIQFQQDNKIDETDLDDGGKQNEHKTVSSIN